MASFKIREAHWEVLISFLENHKEMATGLFSGPDGKAQLKQLWQELATKLNSLGLGERSSDKWQKTWTDFKYLLKKKGSQVVKDQTATGGGAATVPAFNALELRALQVLGGDSFYKGVGVAETAVTKSSLGTPERIPFRSPEPSTSGVKRAASHDHSYVENKKSKVSTPPIEDAYAETINLLREINSTLDGRLGQIADSLDKLVQIFQNK